MLVRDLRFGFRFLASRPGFTAAVVLALAIGIGANTALFSIVNGMLLRPLPYYRAGELVDIEHTRRELPLGDLARAQALAGVAAFEGWGFSVSNGEETTFRFGFRVSANLFQVLGSQAAIGRVFRPEEDREPVVVLGYDYWRQVSGDPKIIGRTLTIGGEKYTVVGVLPPDFTLGVRDANVFVPSRSAQSRVIARLASGATLSQAEAEARCIAESPGNRIRVRPLAETMRPGSAGTVLLLQTALGLVLLITCADVANLLLVRAISRRKEFAIRAAIGGGRAHLFRQVMTEGLLLAVLGGTAGLLFAKAILGFIGARLPATISRYVRGADPFGIDHRVLAFTAGISLLAVILFAAAPAAICTRVDLMAWLRDSARGQSPARHRWGQVLIALEVGLALMLLVGTGLTLKSLAGLMKVNLGFSPDHVLRVAVDLPPSRYPTPGQKARAVEEMVQRLETLPGVETAGALAPQLFPFGGPRVRGAIFQIAGRPDIEARAEVYVANPSYLRSVRIPLLKGRWFTAADRVDSAPVAIVSESVANRYWGQDDPIGRQVRLDAGRPESAWATIVGVAGDVRNPVGIAVQPTAYRPFAQSPAQGAALMIRTTGDPMLLAEGIRKQLRLVDPAMTIRTADLAAEVSSYITPQRFTASLLGFFASLGLLLAAVGVYGVMHYWVGARIPEIGLRLALGAGPGDVFRLVVGRAAVPAVIGVLLGVAGAVGVRRFLASELYGVSALDPAVYLGVAVFIGSVALIAASLPARSAARIDPAVALRQD